MIVFVGFKHTSTTLCTVLYCTLMNQNSFGVVFFISFLSSSPFLPSVFQFFIICRRILIDTGEKDKPEFISNLKKVFQEKGISLEAVLITHWHRDHCGGITDVFEGLNLGENFDLVVAMSLLVPD